MVRGWGLLVFALVLLGAFLTLVPPAYAPPGPGIDFVVIQRDPTSNGTWVEDGTYYAGDKDGFWLVGYNATRGWVGPVHGNWWVDNPGSGSVTPANNVTSTTFSAGPKPGMVRIHAYCVADPGGGGCGSGNQTAWFNATGPLTVLRSPVAELNIRDAANGGGTIVLDSTYYVGDSDAFWAAGYDANGSFTGDVTANWTSDQPGVCSVLSSGTSATFRAVGPGSCRATATYETSNGTVWNRTGVLTVLLRPAVYADDDGRCGGNLPCFATLAAAIANAADGYLVVVYPGTYLEEVVVDKRVRILGIDREGIRVDGGGSGTAFLVRADFVEIGNLTITNAQYGILVDRANNTRIVDTTVQNYHYGLYFNRTREAFTAWNLITRGTYGVVTDHATNDAVRWNEISYNTAYGAKDFDSTLRNCFNWNKFHHNKVAYWYDPDLPLSPFEFDGNLVEDNEVGVLVENGPALRLTNNVFRRNGRALEIVGSDLNVSANSFEENGRAIELSDADGTIAANGFVGNTWNVRCSRSAARIEENTINGGETGVECTEFSGVIARNTFATDGVGAIVLAEGGPATIRDNVAAGLLFSLTRVVIGELVISDSTVISYDSSLDSVILGGDARVLERRSLTIRVVDEAAGPVRGARVEVRDRHDRVVKEEISDAEGRIRPLSILARSRTSASDTILSPFRVRASIDDRTAEAILSLDGPESVTLTVRGTIVPLDPQVRTIPWGLILFGSLIAVSAATLLGLEPLKYALLALVLPLFTRIRRENVLDDYTRGRVYQYLEMSPGDHFHGICRALSLGAGTVTYHLEVLTRLGLVSSRADGVYKRFYPMGVRPPAPNGGPLSEVQTRITRAVRDLPGVTQKELVAILGLRQSTLYYQMTQLASKGLIRVERRGRNVRYYPREDSE